MPAESARELPDFVEDLGHGIYAIDTAFQRARFDAAYLLVDHGRAALIDTGTALAVPRLLATLQSLGLGCEQVDWIIPTHVHLDHAGGVGLLLQSLPQATVLVHPRGARHLIDPRALYQGALAVYGQAEMDKSYGSLVAVPAERVHSSSDGLCVAVGGRSLELIDTPGHARHHHAIWDPLSRGWFTGDTFGLCYRELNCADRPWILPTTTPVQFEPEALRETILRLLARDPQRVYLTHYGAHDRVADLGIQLLALLKQMVDLARPLARAPERHAALRQGLQALYLGDLRAAGNTRPEAEILDWLSMDIELNAQGLGIWLDRLAH